MKSKTLSFSLILWCFLPRAVESYLPAPLSRGSQIHQVLFSPRFRPLQAEAKALRLYTTINDRGDNVSSNNQKSNGGGRALHLLSAALPMSAPWWLATCVVPPLVLGQIKSEYTVSFGYGTAVSATAAYLIWKVSDPISALWWAHASSLVFYGARLNAFLFRRIQISQRQKDMVKRIEDRANERGGRASRVPFALSCGLLYYGLCAPAILTKHWLSTTAVAVPPLFKSIFGILVATQWSGYILAAVADQQKTSFKVKNGEDSLVTTGVWSLWRHPNYSGETIGWTANVLSGILGAIFLLVLKANNSVALPISMPGIAVNLASSILGWMGIVFVLNGATRNLEKKQRETYGSTEQYQEWTKSTWAGWKFPVKKESQETTHEIKPEIVEEDSGSGI